MWTGEIDNSTIIFGDLDTLFLIVDRTTRQKLGKETEDTNDATTQLNVIDGYRTLHPATAAYILFSSTYGIFSRADRTSSHN